MQKRALVIGKSGQLGNQLLQQLPRLGFEVIAPDRQELDLSRPSEAAAFVSSCRAHAVINTAAFHNVVACESEAEQAFAINSLAVHTLARACAEKDIAFITFSTDYVFDGEKRAAYFESDRACPLQVYGASKLAGECLALAAHPMGARVIRTCGVFGARGARQKGGNFIEQRILEAAGAEHLEVGADQTISPTYAVDLASAVGQLLKMGDHWPAGIYHLANEGQCTWAEFAAEAFRLLGLPTKIKEVDRGGRSGKMRRPLFSALANQRAAALGVTLPRWQDALARYVLETRGSSVAR